MHEIKKTRVYVSPKKSWAWEIHCYPPEDQSLKWGFVNLLILAHVKCHVSSVPTNQAEQKRLWSRMENTGHSGHTNKHHLINAQPLKVSWVYISFPVLQISHVSSSVCKSHHACTVLPTRVSFNGSFLSISSDHPPMTCPADCSDRRFKILAAVSSTCWWH